MEKLVLKLPGNQRTATQLDPQGRLVDKAGAPQAQKEFDVAWEEYRNEWVALRAILFTEAFYSMPCK